MPELIDLLLRETADSELRNEAAGELVSLVTDFVTEEIPDDGSYTYDDDNGAAERFMLGGFGPTTYAVFVEFGDDLSGHIEYTGGLGTAVVAIPETIVSELRSRLRRDAKARRAR